MQPDPEYLEQFPMIAGTKYKEFILSHSITYENGAYFFFLFLQSTISCGHNLSLSLPLFTLIFLSVVDKTSFLFTNRHHHCTNEPNQPTL